MANNDAADPEWHLMRDIRRRTIAGAVWIPLRQSETIRHEGENGKVGEIEEVACSNSVAFFPQHRGLAERLGWSELGLMHDAMPYAFRDGRYKPVESYWHHEKIVAGVELIFIQRFNGDHDTRWIINPDLTIALGLMEEGDSWVCVDEGYAEVIRSRRDATDRIVAIEIKADFLRDYLAARGLSLRVAQYRQRMAIVADAAHIPWLEEPIREGEQPHRFQAEVFEVDASGDLFGDSIAVFETWRTDADNDEDVPEFGPETSENTGGRSFSFTRAGQKAYRVEGELWREEWIEPASKSVRIRGDKPDEEFFYVVDASGKRVPGSDLKSEDVGKYLWFKPTVIKDLLSYRGAGLGWYTGQTGSVRCSPDYETHFGINRVGLINVYAYDVAKLPHWQQRIWSGHNASPDGQVSSELLDSQQRCCPADTVAPEQNLNHSYASLNEKFAERFGDPLFRGHESVSEILRQVHRFRGLDVAGVYALAKDIARLTADDIDVMALKTIVVSPEKEKWGSLRHLQKALETIVDSDTAKKALTALVGIYELRLADAHLPKSDLDKAYGLIGISQEATPLEQAFGVIGSADSSLSAILAVVEKVPPRGSSAP